MDLAFIPECYVDTNLLETISPFNGRYNHQKGCGTVAKVMQKSFLDRFAVGIIDKDKREIKYLEEFELACSSGSLTLYKHRSRHHYMILISPAMERFILSSVADAEVDLPEFGLPTDLSELKKESKTVNSKDDPRFKGLFRLLVKKKAPEIMKLVAWIEYLRANTYQTDIKALGKL